MSVELEQITGLLNPQTGELLPVTTDNIAAVLNAARTVKAHVDGIVTETTRAAVALTRERGTRTLHGDTETVTVSGGPGLDYDPMALVDELTKAGCPQDRIEAAVVATVTYRVNRSVLRELRGSNPAYKRAIDHAEIEVERRYQATVKPRSNHE